MDGVKREGVNPWDRAVSFSGREDGRYTFNYTNSLGLLKTIFCRKQSGYDNGCSSRLS